MGAGEQAGRLDELLFKTADYLYESLMHSSRVMLMAFAATWTFAIALA